MQRFIASVTFPMYQLYWRAWKPKTTRVRVILVHGNDILLVRHMKKRYWNLPSGKVEKGETLVSALMRELQEELGITNVVIIKKLGVYRQKTNTRDDQVHVFIGTLPRKTPLVLQWEIAGARWVSLRAIPPLTQQGTKQRIYEYLSGKEQVYSLW